MVKYLFLILFIFLTTSCSYEFAFRKVPKYIKDNFTLCYSSNSVENKGIKLNGYYTYNYSIIQYSYPDSLTSNHFDGYINIIFFRTGIVLYDFSCTSLAKGNTNKERIEDYFNLVLKDVENQKRVFLNGEYWGLYEIHNDTLIIECLGRPTKMGGPWGAQKKIYKMINDSSLVEIEREPIIRDEEMKYYYKYVRPYEKYISSTLKFVPLEIIPPSDCWLKKEKWFWCNETDWQHYMDSIKIQKKR